MTNRLPRKPTVSDALAVLERLAGLCGASDLEVIAKRARNALSEVSAQSDVARVARLNALIKTDPPSLDVVFESKTLQDIDEIVRLCEPKVAGATRWRLVREVMAAAARNPNLVEQARLGSSEAELVASYVGRLLDDSLSPEDFPMVVEELLADNRLRAADQRKVIMRVTGAPPRRLGNIDNRRIELLSWRRQRASDDYLFHARANEKRRF